VGADGTLYFGNRGQVLVFDGQTWDRVPVPGGAHVRALAMDARGTLWIGAVNELGRVETDPDGSRRFVSLRSAVPKEAGDLGTIWTVHATPAGVWFQSNSAVLRWDGTKFDYWATGERSICLSFWMGDHLLVALMRGWFKPVADGKWEELGRPEDKLGQYLPHFAIPHPKGGWLMGLEGAKGEVAGLARWDGHTLTLEPHPLDEWFRARRLYTGRRLADGRYVLTTLQGGAVVLGPDLSFETWLNEKTGLESDAVISATPDPSGAVWLGTEWGLSRLQLHPAFTWFGPANGLGRRGVDALVRWDGRLLVGDLHGLLTLKQPDGLPGMPRFERWSSLEEKIDGLAVARGSLLAYGLGGVWQVMPGGEPRRVHNFSNIFDLAESRARPDLIYCASLNGLSLWRWAGDQLTYDSSVKEVRGNSLAEAADGSVWTGTDNQGVWRVTFEGEPAKPVAKRFGADSGLPDVNNNIRVELIGGAPLFLTGKGLYRFDPATERFRPESAYGARLADGSMFVRAISEDAAGTVWLIAEPAGSEESAGSELGCVRHGEWTPLPVPEVSRMRGKKRLVPETVGGRDILWVLGQSAALRIDLTAWREKPVPAVGRALIREAVTRGGQRLPLADAGRLGAADNSLRISFGVPGLAGEPEALYETGLRGLDGSTELAARGERSFANLAPGDYVFSVRGRTNDGRWSEPAELAFTVLAPWWQTPWARAGLVLAVGLALFGYIRWRIRRLTRERNRLEAIVGDRTAELAQKNRELERLHRVDQDEKLAARLAEEKAQLELLRYQLNPHFLYNSLNSIRALVFANADAAAEMVTRLSEFCRWTLTRGADGMTTVGEEVEMLQAYLDIERTRWQDGLKARIEVDPAVRRDPLPQFLFLPLLENAIKYGGRTSPSVLEVAMVVRLEDNALVCEVSNTGHWIAANGREGSPLAPAPNGSANGHGESTRIGLDNLRRRLARYYGPDCKPEVVTMPGWVSVRLRLSRNPNRPGSASPV
jgi:ligand-binding sensor domain-containing protein